MRKRYFVPLLSLLVIFLLLSSNCDAQTKWSLDVNLGVFQPVGKDVAKLYTSVQQPWVNATYYPKEKFDYPYFGILPNLTYSVTSALSFGIQTGIYGHNIERYTRSRNPFFVTVPLMATGKINIAGIKKNKIGLNIAAGRNFFHYNSFRSVLKNGWIYNVSAFYSTKKSIFKVGFEHQVDNAIFYYISDNSFSRDETFRYKQRRSAVTISYGYIIK